MEPCWLTEEIITEETKVTLNEDLIGWRETFAKWKGEFIQICWLFNQIETKSLLLRWNICWFRWKRRSDKEKLKEKKKEISYNYFNLNIILIKY